MDKATRALPVHFQWEYPKLIAFMRAYYEWKDGRYDAIPQLLKDLNDVDTINRVNRGGVGAESSNIMDDFTLTKTPVEITTLDGKTLTTSDGFSICPYAIHDDHLKAWYEDVGFIRPSTVSKSQVDDVLFLRLFRDIGKIRGVEHATRLFFKIFFGEQIDIFYPKTQMAVLDDTMILDGDSFLRDDFLIDEFSFVIYVDGEVSKYVDLFNSVYLKYFHFGGSVPFLAQQVYSFLDIQISNVNGATLVTYPDNVSFVVDENGYLLVDGPDSQTIEMDADNFLVVTP